MVHTLIPELLLQIHHVLVRGGPGGYEAFVDDIRRMFGITEELDMHLAFDCADPLTGAHPAAHGRLSCVLRSRNSTSAGTPAVL